VLEEPESPELRRYLRGRRLVVTSAIARTEVVRAVLRAGADAKRRAEEVLTRVTLVRLNDRILRAAGAILPVEHRTLDAIHLATAQQFGPALSRLVTYDERLGAAARATGLTVAAPA